MTTRERFQEVEAVTLAFQAALTKIGAEVIIDLLNLWNSNIDPSRISTTFPTWLDRTETVIGERRPQARDLAISYYRLTRGLATGYTVTHPDAPGDRGDTTLAQLRSDFLGLLDDADVPRSRYPLSAQEAPGFTRIETERIDFDRSDEAAIEADAAQEAVVTLTANGPENLRRKVRVIDRRESAEVVDEEREKARKKAGAAQAATGERLVRNAARSRLWEMLRKDSRVIGYVRHSLTGTPCGWCAMLISRGLVLAYKSASSAEFSDGDLYHDNCKCVAIPVYSQAQYDSMSLFDLNREYGKLWPEVTKGLSGKEALSAWRKFIRAQNPQEGSSTTETAQEA